MNQKRALFWTVLIVLLLAGLPAVSAQTNVLESVAQIFGGQDFGTIYNNYWWIIDLIIYLFLFGFVGKLALGHQFQGKGGSLGIIVGVALAISVVFFESNTGFRLGHIGPFGLAVALVIFGIVVYRLFEGLFPAQGGGLNGAALAFTFVAIYGFLITIASPLFIWVARQNNPYLSFLSAILNIALLASLVVIVWKGAGFITRTFQGGNPVQNLFQPQAPQPHQPAQHQAQQGAQANQRQQQIAQIVGNINQLENRLLALMQNQQLNQQQRLNELANLLALLIQYRQQIANIPP